MTEKKTKHPQEQFKTLLNSYPVLVRIRAKLMFYLTLTIIPVMIFFLVFNLLKHERVYFIQNAMLLVLFGVTLFAIYKKKYDIAVTSIFTAAAAVSIASFIIQDLFINESFYHILYTAGLVCLGIVLVGIFSVSKGHLIFAGLIFSSLLIMHIAVSPPRDISPPHLNLTIITFFLLSTGIAIFSFRIFQRLGKSLEEKTLLNEKLKETIDDKDQFYANLSHELRNPLNAIAGMTDLLLSSQLKQDQKPYVEKIQTTNQLLLGMVANILSLKKIGDDSIQFNLSECSLSDLLDKVCSLYEARIKEKGISLKRTFPENRQDTILSDPQLLSRIFINLMDNAFKFTEKGEIEVSTARISREQDISAYQITIRDSGIGMEKKTRDHIFDSLYQEENGYTKTHAGIGIGMAVVKELVELLKGEITIDSSPGMGTEVTVTLPLLIRNISDHDDSPLHQHLDEKEPAKTGPFTICLAEDEAINRLYLSTALRRSGHTVLEAHNGTSVCRIIDDNSIDIVLLDIQMPEMSGFEVARYIRNHTEEQKRDMTIIAFTGYSLNKEKELMEESGIDEILLKPLDAETVEKKIEELQSGNRTMPGTT